MKQVSDALMGSALLVAQLEQIARETRDMFKQRCAEEQISEQQRYELLNAAQVAVKRNFTESLQVTD